MKNMIIERAHAYVKEFFSRDCTGHDYFHTVRVYNTAIKIANDEGADAFCVGLCALLHDVDDKKLSPSTAENKDNARKFMRECGLDDAFADKICEMIDQISFSKNGDKAPSTLEGKCVQDADRLDAIGAIGIARAFAFGGSRERGMFDPKGEDKNTTVEHFYDKLFKLKELMNTESAQKMAAARDKFMHEYIDRFYSEWNGEQ